MFSKPMKSLTWLTIAGLTIGASADGLFIVNCQPLTVQRGDPIIFPGQVSPHVHGVVGGTNFALTESNADARAAQGTTCNVELDKSNYWQPSLYHLGKDGKFELIKLLGIAGYYIARACDYAPGRQNCNGLPSPRAPPAGLRMVVGDPTRQTYDKNNFEHKAISHVCLDPGGDTVALPQSACAEMRTQTFFPSCWDGTNLDSADHKSHMAFPAIGDYNGGVCPQSHPHAIVSVFTEFFHNTRQVTAGNFNRWVYAEGDAVGYGLHADYVQGWTDQGRLENAMATCTGDGGFNNVNCSINLHGAAGPGNAQSKSPQKAPPNEEVGLNGKLDKLPGNNPVRYYPL